MDTTESPVQSDSVHPANFKTTYIADHNWAISFFIDSDFHSESLNCDQYINFGKYLSNLVDDLKATHSAYSKIALPILKDVQLKHQQRMDVINIFEVDDQGKRQVGLDYIRAQNSSIGDFARAYAKIVVLMADKYLITNCRIEKTQMT